MKNAGHDEYPQTSYYTHSANISAIRSGLKENSAVDVAVIGGGYTGLSAGLHLAEQGTHVAVLEANRVGWGASGRNGGQIHSGQRQSPEWFEERFGLETAKDYFRLGEAGKKLVFDLIKKHNIACDVKPGLIHAAHKRRFVAEFQTHAEHMAAHYDHAIDWLDAQETAARLGTDVYYGALFDASGGHLHPLKFALGLAHAAEAAGCKIFEQTKITRIDVDKNANSQIVLETSEGHRITASQVILATNGYLSGLEGKTEAHVMPINNYIAATRPLRSDEIPIVQNECASDSRFVVNYWRMSADKRLLFGGGENYSKAFPNDIASFVRKPLSRIYPQFKNIEIDFAWGGTLAVTVSRVPFFDRPQPQIWVASGYSGQGVTIAPLAGQILAEAILGDQSRYNAFSALCVPPFPGGRLFRYPKLVAAMSWFALRDRL